jgi:eukaryotic-like serine/threonine-protein kinase
LFRATGKTSEALAAYEKAMEIQERLVQYHPTATEFALDLAGSQYNIGNLLGENGKPSEALLAYKKTLAIQRQLVRDHPTEAQFQANLARSHRSIGMLLDECGQPSEALAEIGKAMTIQQQLVRDHPTVVQFQQDLSTSHSDIGVLLSATGQASSALAAYEQALTIEEHLARDHPTVTEYQGDLARTHRNIGGLLGGSGKPSEGLAAYERALDIQQRLLREHPTITQFHADVATSHHGIGVLRYAIGQPSDALAAYEQAQTIREQLVRDHPTRTEFHRDLASTYSFIGDVLDETGQPNKALDVYEKALATRERLVKDYPNSPQFASEFGGLLNDIATIELRQVSYITARDHLRQAITWQKRALATNAEQPVYRAYLKNHFVNLLHAAEGLADQELHTEAERGFAELEVSEPSRAKTEARIKAIIGGEKEKSSAELMTLGKRANETMRYALAVKLWNMAFDRYPGFADELAKKRRFNAAVAAALAADGQGIDVPAPDEEAKVKLREQALQWLNANLEALKKLIGSGDEKQKAEAEETLNAWQAEPNLSSVRGEAIAKLPENQQQTWHELWKQVAESVGGEMPKTDSGSN